MIAHARTTRRLTLGIALAMVLAGLVPVLTLRAGSIPGDGTVAQRTKIADGSGGFLGTLPDDGLFGASLAPIGDLDGDGIGDVAVGACFDNDGGFRRGAVWILFLDAEGAVRAHQKISSIAGGFAGVLDDEDLFGRSIGPLGDLDGDGVVDIAVGACRDDDGGMNRGSFWVLFLNPDGTVKSHQKVSDTQGGLGGGLVDFDQFGEAIAALGDFDGDEIPDIAVGSGLDDDGGPDRGAVRIIRLNADGTVKAVNKISSTAGGFGGSLSDGDSFGWAVAADGDRSGDGIPDLVLGAPGDDDGGLDRGAVWILYLNADGTVQAHHKISDTVGGFNGALADGDRFGGDVAVLGDVDRDGVADIAAGAPNHGVAGAVWTLRLEPDETVGVEHKIVEGGAGFEGPLGTGDSFGFTVSSPGDLGGDGIADLAVGAIGDDGIGGNNRGAMWLIDLVPACGAGTVDDASGDPVDRLFVNGDAGGPARTVHAGGGALIWCTMLGVPAGGNGKFVVHANFGSPVLADVTALPSSIGTVCFSMLLPAGAAPDAVWNGVGRVAQVGASRYFDGSSIADPGPAPEVFLQLDAGDAVNLPPGTEATFQGAIIDPGSTSPKNASATNAVILIVE